MEHLRTCWSGDEVCPGGVGPRPHDPCCSRGGRGPTSTPAQTLRSPWSQQTPEQSPVSPEQPFQLKTRGPGTSSGQTWLQERPPAQGRRRWGHFGHRGLLTS